MGLHMRQVGQMTWVLAVCAFVLRYTVVNAFATCRQLGLCKETTYMWEWQWQVLWRRYCAHLLRQVVHAPVASQWRVCHFCKRGRTGYKYTGSRKAFHMLCFVPAHGYGGVEGTRDMEVDEEHEEDDEADEDNHEEDEGDGEYEEDEEDEEDKEDEECEEE